MFDKELAQFIAGHLRVRRQAFENDSRKHIAAQLDRAIATMDSFASGESIASVWNVDDVQALDSDMEGDSKGLNITDAEAKAVLAQVADGFDAEYGINWDTLNDALNDVLAERGEDPNGGDGQDD